MHKDYHVFFSYARKDNEPDHTGWVTHFHDALVRQHEAMTGRPLQPFFDRQAIDSGQRWKFRLGEGLRRSRLFLAFLSQNYLDSEVCRWEWEQYLMHEHSAARGDDGVVPLYFVQLGELDAGGDPLKERWLEEIQERHLGAYCDLQPWFDGGEAALAELDAAERLDALREADRVQDAPRSLAERVAAVNIRLSRRLDRIWLADHVIGNVERRYEHFRGRHAELRQLHEHLINGSSGLITATHGPGGLGKSALARQYAVAYADFYAAGGVWEIGCAGRQRLGDALAQLQNHSELRDEGFNLDYVREADADTRAREAFERLRKITKSRQETIQQQLRTDPECRTPERLVEDFDVPRCLLILDNVDCPELLAADQQRLIPNADWLGVVVTTRCDPAEIGGMDAAMATVEVGSLPEAEGVELLRSFMPGEEFPSIEEEEYARELVREVGGYTLVLELIGAYINVNANSEAAPSQYLGVLQREGLADADKLSNNPKTAQRITHEQKQVGAVLDDTLADLRRAFEQSGEPELADAAITALEFASLLQPDAIPTDWLQQLVAEVHPEAMAERDDGLPAWGPIWQVLYGRRVLQPARTADYAPSRAQATPQLVRLHRIIGAQIRKAMQKNLNDRWQRLEAFLYHLGYKLEHETTHHDDDPVFAQYPVLRDQVEFLLNEWPKHISTSVLRTASVTASIEGTHGLLSRACELSEHVLCQKEALLAAEPESPDLERDVSVSQRTLGDLLLERGELGDANTASQYFKDALATAQDLWQRNPDSAQAIRDVAVSQESLGEFHRERGDTGIARQYVKDALATAQDQWRRDLDSTQAARDISALKGKLGELHRQCGDADLAHHYLEAALTTEKDLWHRNAESAKAARGVLALQRNLGDLHWQRGDTDIARQYLKDALATAQDQWRRNSDSAQASRDVSVLKGDLGELHRQCGDADLAHHYLEAALTTEKDLWHRNPESAKAARDVSESQHNLGDLHLQRGEVDIAHQYFKDTLATVQDLWWRNPDSVQAIRDVAVSQQILGDFHRNRGDADIARQYFKDSLATAQDHWRRNPYSDQAIRDVAVSQHNLGDLHLQRGDVDIAHQYFKDSLATAQDRWQHHPDSVQAGRGVSSLQGKLGDFHRQRGEDDIAHQYVKDSLATAQDLWQRHPNRVEVAREVSTLQTQLGDFHRQRGEDDIAFQYFKDALATAQDLWQRYPDSALDARIVSVLKGEFGDLHRKRGEDDIAFQYFKDALATAQDLWQHEPDSAQAARDVSVLMSKLGDLHQEHGEAGTAKLYFEGALTTFKDLWHCNPDSAQAARDVSKLQNKLGYS